MYFAMLILLLVVLPAASVGVDAFRFHPEVSTLFLVGRWWAFWAVGVRLFIAGLRQVIQPSFTAREIFGIDAPGSLAIVREVGFANLSMGVLGICSLLRMDWVIPSAIVGGLYCGLAGSVHIFRKDKNAKEVGAMISDVFVFVILAVFVVRSLI